MNCLCCGKALRSKNTSGWHTSCINRFFGTSKIPEIVLDEKTLAELATRNASRGHTIPGVQKKLSLHLSDEQEPRLTIVNHPTGYILKPQVQEFRALPEAEQLAMSMADIAGIATVPHALVRVNGTAAYLTKRIDRVFVPGAENADGGYVVNLEVDGGFLALTIPADYQYQPVELTEIERYPFTYTFTNEKTKTSFLVQSSLHTQKDQNHLLKKLYDRSNKFIVVSDGVLDRVH